MAATAKTKARVKKKPVKAGSTEMAHGGFPTNKAMLIRTKLIAEIKKKNNG